MLTLNNIACERGGRRLFSGLGFTVGDCCTVIIRGGNGSGKTTLLNTIACLSSPADGEILYANENVRGEHWAEYCGIINYIGHKNAVKPQLTVRENIEFWADLTDSGDRTDAAMSFFDLDQYADVLCYKLSVGWQKKVALARLLACRSEIWLLDEPFASLDEETSLKLASIMQTRCEQGGSVILTAHGSVPIESSCEIRLEDFA